MGQVTIRGIVTRYANYQDNDRIISIITAEHGRIDAKARGCRRPKSPLLPATQTFVYAEFELFEGKDHAVVNRADVLESFYPIREDINRLAYGQAMLSLANEAFQPKESGYGLFLLVYHALTYLAYSESDAQDLFLAFLLKYLDATGYCPAITVCGVCGRDIRQDAHIYHAVKGGGAVCAACARGYAEISKLALEVMRRILIMDVADIKKVKLTDSLRRELEIFLFEQVNEHFEYGARCLQTLDKFRI